MTDVSRLERPDVREREPELEVLRPFRRLKIDVATPPAEVPILAGFLYAGRLSVLQAEPAAGKSWLATWLAMQLVDDGYPVIYIDEEGGRDLVTERLIALGADPHAVAERFHYFAFESRSIRDEDLLAYDELIRRVPGCALVVLDSLPDFLAAAGLSEDSAQDVTTFVNNVCRRFRDAGIAQLVLDHLVKPTSDGKGKRSRYSRGSGAKLAKADATLLLEVVDEFDAHTSGRLHLWKTKDRRGRLELPPLTKPGLPITVTVDKGTVDIAADEAAVDIPTWDGPRACMDAVLALLESAAPAELSGNTLIAQMRAAGHPFRDKTVREAADRLAVQGVIAVRSGANRSRLYMWRPPENGREVPLDEQF